MFGQETPSKKDSLVALSYDELLININDSWIDSVRISYGEAYLKKARLNKDTLNIVTGYEILSILNTGKHASLFYNDSIVRLTVKKPDALNPGNAHLRIGNQYYLERSFKKALDHYLKANEHGNNFDNLELVYDSSHGIGVLKNRIGDYQESIDIHLDNITFYRNNINNLGNKYYLNSLFSIATAYTGLMKLDSAYYYNHLGINLSLAEKHDEI